MSSTAPSTSDTATDLDGRLRTVPTQARSRERVRQVLDAADRLLADEGAEAFTTTRIAAAAGIPVGSVYRYFPDKQVIVEALAVRYWDGFAALVSAVADRDEETPLPDPGGAVLDALAGCFRTQPGFRALWYGGLRTERVRDVTRPTRDAIAGSIERILTVHWPHVSAEQIALVARMVVVAGDGMLREAFRAPPETTAVMLAESRTMLDAYVRVRLGAAP